MGPEVRENKPDPKHMPSLTSPEGGETRIFVVGGVMERLEKVLSRSSAILCGLIMAFGASIASFALGVTWTASFILDRSIDSSLGGYIGFGVFRLSVGDLGKDSGSRGDLS
ncbi:MAG: hypothetical protein OEW84_00580 [Aigarchaeota archaeon]|nr:hypothetical protein [Aigarchaeota archaeon]